LRHQNTAADIALFGRMLASQPSYNTEAAAQVAHAISVHRVQVEDDFFTAVDDLNLGVEDVGAGHMGETEFGAGVYYLYICINRELLRENLGGDGDLAARTLSAMLECVATIAPTGKQNSFASRAYASYAMAEKGDQQPRSLSVAYLKPIDGADMLTDAIGALEKKREKMVSVYGPCASDHYVMNAETGNGSLAELIAFAAAE
jgi:CRISPR system Cascade subunit CasC